MTTSSFDSIIDILVKRGVWRMTSEEELRNRIEGTAIEGRIRCAEALAIARDLKVSPKHVGDTLNGMNVKIINCQLGCFP
jgi:hypothetical protein